MCLASRSRSAWRLPEASNAQTTRVRPSPAGGGSPRRAGRRPPRRSRRARPRCPGSRPSGRTSPPWGRPDRGAPDVEPPGSAGAPPPSSGPPSPAGPPAGRSTLTVVSSGENDPADARPARRPAGRCPGTGRAAVEVGSAVSTPGRRLEPAGRLLGRRSPTVPRPEGRQVHRDAHSDRRHLEVEPAADPLREPGEPLVEPTQPLAPSPARPRRRRGQEGLNLVVDRPDVPNEQLLMHGWTPHGRPPVRGVQAAATFLSTGSDRRGISRTGSIPFPSINSNKSRTPFGQRSRRFLGPFKVGAVRLTEGDAVGPLTGGGQTRQDGLRPPSGVVTRGERGAEGFGPAPTAAGGEDVADPGAEADEPGGGWLARGHPGPGRTSAGVRNGRARLAGADAYRPGGRGSGTPARPPDPVDPDLGDAQPGRPPATSPGRGWRQPRRPGRAAGDPSGRLAVVSRGPPARGRIWYRLVGLDPVVHPRVAEERRGRRLGVDPQARHRRP